MRSGGRIVGTSRLLGPITMPDLQQRVDFHDVVNGDLGDSSNDHTKFRILPEVEVSIWS